MFQTFSTENYLYHNFSSGFLLSSTTVSALTRKKSDKIKKTVEQKKKKKKKTKKQQIGGRKKLSRRNDILQNKRYGAQISFFLSTPKNTRIAIQKFFRSPKNSHSFRFLPTTFFFFLLLLLLFITKKKKKAVKDIKERNL